jgi:Transposase, Mutator family
LTAVPPVASVLLGSVRGDPPKIEGGTTVSENVPVAGATCDEAVLPERVQEALGQLVEAAREGLLALSVGVGLGVLTELMEEEVCDVVGPKGKHDAQRTAVRHGHEDGEVTLGGRRVEVRRPRVRSANGEREVPLATYEHFADRDPLARVVLERMLAGVSTRRYRRTQEPVGEQVETRARSTSKSAVSRSFVERTREALSELMGRQLLASNHRGDAELGLIALSGRVWAVGEAGRRVFAVPRSRVGVFAVARNRSGALGAAVIAGWSPGCWLVAAVLGSGPRGPGCGCQVSAGSARILVSAASQSVRQGQRAGR